MLWTEDGREQTFARLEAGTYLGELSAIDGHQRSLSAYAQTDTELLIVSQADFHKLIDHFPDIRNRIMIKLVGLIRRLTERNYQTTSLSVGDRLRAYLVRLALEKNAMRLSGSVGRVASRPSPLTVRATFGPARTTAPRRKNDNRTLITGEQHEAGRYV